MGCGASVPASAAAPEALDLHPHHYRGEVSTTEPTPLLLATGSGDKTARLWRVEDGRCVRTLEGHSDLVRSVAFSADGALLATGSLDKTARLWRVEDGRCARTLEGHSGCVYSVAFSADGALLATGSVDKTARLWRVEDGRCVRTLEGHSDLVRSVAFSADGALLATGSLDKTARLWRIEDGRRVHTLEGHSGCVWSVAFSADGALLATGSSDKTARLWRIEDGRRVHTLEGHSGCVWSVAFSADGALLATCSSDRTARLWRVEDGRRVRTLEGHSGYVNSVAFSADGALLATGSDDKTARLWRVEDGRCVRTLEGHLGCVTSVAFSDFLGFSAGCYQARKAGLTNATLLQAIFRLPGQTASGKGQALASAAAWARANPRKATAAVAKVTAISAAAEAGTISQAECQSSVASIATEITKACERAAGVAALTKSLEGARSLLDAGVLSAEQHADKCAALLRSAETGVAAQARAELPKRLLPAAASAGSTTGGQARRGGNGGDRGVGDSKEGGAAPLNAPGHWDFFVSYTQRDPAAQTVARALFQKLREAGQTCWLDVEMGSKSEAAMREGVLNAKCFVAVVSDAYLTREFCLKELAWAKDNGKTIQPVVAADDKARIGELIGVGPPEAQFLRGIDFVDLHMSDREYMDVGVKKICRNV